MTKVIQPALPGKKTRGQKFLSDLWSQRALLMMVIPGLLIVFLFNYVPMYGVTIAWKKYNVGLGIAGSPWVGWKWFTRFFASKTMSWQLIRNTVLLGLYQLLWSFPMPIILALMMDQIRNMRFKKLVQTVSYFPHFISTVIVVSLLKDFFAVDGFINGITALFGMEPISFLTKPQYFRSIFVGSHIWQEVGWGTILYLAALSNVDPQLYEAAEIDGANRWQRVVHITWPCLVPTVTIQIIFAVSGILGADSQKVLLLYNYATYETADIIGTYVYREGLLGGKYEYTAAIGMMQSAVSCILLLAANGLSRAVGDTSLW